MERRDRLFGQLFTKYRLKAEIPTLAEFGKALAAERLLYEDSIFSRWQKGNRIPKERKVLLTILKVFIARKGIQTAIEANQIMQAAKQKPLIDTEEEQLFGSREYQKDGLINAHIFTNFIPMAEKHFDSLLSTIVHSSEQLPHLALQADLLYDLIEEGYSSIAYNRYGKLLTVINLLKLNAIQEGKELIGKINWMSIECLSQTSGTQQEYDNVLKEIDTAMAYANDNSTRYLGELYWMRALFERKKYLTQNSTDISKDTMLQSLLTAQTGLTKIPANDPNKISVLFEILYFSLLFKDKNLFNKTLFETFSAGETLPPELQYLKAYIWDVKARGSIRFGLRIDSALEYIKTAKSYSSPRYQNVNLNLRATEFQALDVSPNPEHHKYAEKLREQLLLESIMVENPYQKMRFEKKKFLGL